MTAYQYLIEKEKSEYRKTLIDAIMFEAESLNTKLFIFTELPLIAYLDPAELDRDFNNRELSLLWVSMRRHRRWQELKNDILFLVRHSEGDVWVKVGGKDVLLDDITVNALNMVELEGVYQELSDAELERCKLARLIVKDICPGK